eukprot:TRINITY_DN4042_c0_g1_i1.p1 TRINITY_DN4042_c0_g1~~TRINITY_DN4042_c0_g1_i1.p1  ORF type:complete len:442 (-),score=101.11 TRINITY_DN4042_c0_g1_i1:660-1985(-)
MDEIISSLSAAPSSSSSNTSASAKQVRQSRAVNWGAIDDELSSLLTDLETKVAPKRTSAASRPSAQRPSGVPQTPSATSSQSFTPPTPSQFTATPASDNLSELDALINGLSSSSLAQPMPVPIQTPSSSQSPFQAQIPAPQQMKTPSSPSTAPFDSMPAPHTASVSSIQTLNSTALTPQFAAETTISDMPACDELESMLSKLEGEIKRSSVDVSAVPQSQSQPQSQPQQQPASVASVQEKASTTPQQPPLDPAYYEALPPPPEDTNVCVACMKMVDEDDAFAMACGRKWHMEHFVCTTCKVDLCGIAFYEKYGRPFCEEHYSNIFSPKCGRCNLPILGEYMQTSDKTYHADCFVCENCSQPFGSNPYYVKEGKLICNTCFLDTAVRCAHCNQAITGRYIMALGKCWHQEHFICGGCNTQIPLGNGYKHKDNVPYCMNCKTV